MKLTYFRSEPTNFGDELNAFLWPRQLPSGFLDDDEGELLLGIGSILGDVYPSSSRKVVVSSGSAGYIPLPQRGDATWSYVFVRGPRTAAALGLDRSLAICDGAILLRRLTDLPPPANGIGVAFMPHYQSLQRGRWEEACTLAGITLIDPTWPPERVISMIRGARLLVAEAMHGAIVADAMRTPWVAVRPIHEWHHAKWFDWADSLQIPLKWETPLPSSSLEWATRLSGRSGLGPRARRTFRASPFRTLDAIWVRLAADRLARIATRPGTLSADMAIETATDRASDALHRFVAKRQSALA